MVAAVEESIRSIFTSLSFIESLPFTQTNKLARAVLSTPAEWEGVLLRDAEPEESALFKLGAHDGDGSSRDGSGERHAQAGQRDGRDAGADVNKLRRSILARSTAGQGPGRHNAGAAAWQMTKRKGPQRIGGPEAATPLRKRRQVPGSDKSDDFDDPEPYLLAARRLLQHYPMPRAQEHVELLYSQYEGLMESIADLEEELAKPTKKPLLPKSTQNHAAAPPVDELAELQAGIQREELEILALKELKAEREKESRELDTRLKARRTAAAPSSTSALQSRRDAFRAPGTVTAAASDATRTQSSPRTRTTSSTSRPSTAGTAATAIVAGKRVPAVVAKKLAAEAEARAGKKVAPSPVRPKTVDSARSPAATPKRSTVPSVEIQGSTPSTVAGTPKVADAARPNETPEEARATMDTDVTPRKRDSAQVKLPSASSAGLADAVLPLETLPPAVPQEKLNQILPKIASAMPQSEGLAKGDSSTIMSILASLASPEDDAPSSPASAASTLPGGAAGSLTPVSHVEYHLLHLYLGLLLSRPVAGSTPLSLTLRESAIAGSAGPPDAMLSMNALKTTLGEYAKSKGWGEDLGTKAIYGLVAKRVLRIDRRGREALVAFTS